MKGFVNGYYNLCVWVMKFAYVNLLWVSFTLLGLIVFGFTPATTAMFAVVRKWIMGEKDIAIFKLFWKTYRNEFFKANLLGGLLFILGYILSIELQILRAQDSLVYFIASFGVIAVIILYLIVLMYFFPILVHFNLRTVQYIKWPFIIGIIHPILTVFLIVGVVLINYITFITIPALLFFFGGSVTAYALMWGASQTFAKYEKATI
ncbi:YesL family protein [Virgibacillus necropolis]|uniref:YesL family protein n=1 Tax=Virgibacillus necropolis TaxID=163877 RepID=UPI00384B0E13